MIFGWDISTSVVGLTILNDDGTWVESDFFDFSKIEAKSLFDKMDESEFWIREKLGPYTTGSHHHYVEDRLSNFSFGKTMLQTLMKLASFNTLFSYEIWRIHQEILKPGAGGVGLNHMHPSTVKSIMKNDGFIMPKGTDKKKFTLDFVSRNVPGWKIHLNRNGNPHPYNYDMADSFIVARAAYLKAYLSKNAKGKKNTDRQASPETTGKEPG